MKLCVDRAGALSIEDASDFRRLSMVIEADTPDLRLSLQPLFVFPDCGHALMKVGRFKENNACPRDAEWLAQFDAMIAFARRAGWVDSEERVRIHIE